MTPEGGLDCDDTSKGTTPLKKPAKKAKKKSATKARKVAAKKSGKTRTKTAPKAKAPARKKAARAGKALAKKIAKKGKTSALGKTVATKAVKKAGTKKTTARKAPAKKAAPRLVPTPAPAWPPLVETVLKQLEESKAEAIVTIDVSRKSSIADTMVVASGRSNRHVNAIADQVVEALEREGRKNLRIEGIPQCDWVLVDAGDVMIHVFRPEVRSFYNLEKLWSEHAPH